MMYAKQLFTAILGAGLVYSATVTAQTCSTPYQAISDEPTLSVVKQAIDAAGLKEFLDDPSLDATIFLPNNAGMTTFLETVDASAEDLLGSDRLENFLKNHVHIVAHNISDLYEGEVIDMANGDEISINFKREDDPKYAGCDGNHLHIGSHTNIDSDPIECDIQACQSVIHILDYPLIPDDPALQEEFPKLVLSDIGNDEAHDHDHDDEDHDHEGEDHDHEGEDHDHDHDDEASVSGESVSSSGRLFGFMSSSRLSSIKFRLSGPSNVTRVHLRSDEARISHRGGRLETLLVDPTFDCRSI